MAKVKLQAGAEIDLITAKEVKAALSEARRSWTQELSTGVTFPRIMASGAISGAACDFGADGPASDALMPAPGFLWDVRRLRINGLAANETGVLSVYLNDASPSSLVCSTADLPTGARLFVFSEQLIVMPGEALRIVGTSLTSTGTLTVSGQVRELPVTLAWRLGG